MVDPNFIHIIHAMENDEERNELRVSRKLLRDVGNPLTLPENNFQGIYRLSRELALEVINEISPHLALIRRPEIAVPSHHKILATIHFLSQGSYQKCVGQDYFIPMAQQTLSKCISEVTSVIVNNMGYIIKFPTTVQEKNRNKATFLDVGGFPGIIGAIDCTHIAIQAPPYQNPEMPGILFLNRKGYYSLNTQVIVDANLKIQAINARYPGSVHDSAIWSTSQVRRHLEQNYINGDNSSWLIGDSGYPLEPFLITPVVGNNLTVQELDFNRTHRSTRNVIERFNGVFKARFRCCIQHRTLHYKPAKAAQIIYACAILHNRCIDRRLIIPDLEDVNEVEEHGNEIEFEIIGRNWLEEGRITRERIINNYF